LKLTMSSGDDGFFVVDGTSANMGAEVLEAHLVWELIGVSLLTSDNSDGPLFQALGVSWKMQIILNKIRLSVSSNFSKNFNHY